MSKASTETFLEQMQSGIITTDKHIIFDYILAHEKTTLEQIRTRLRYSHQTASARLSDLMDLGVVEIIGNRKNNKSVFYSELIAVTNEQKIKDNILARGEKRFQKALKSLLSFNNHLEPELKEQLAKHLKVKL